MRKWKIEELVYFSRKPVETTLEELGWFLISDDSSKRLWWRDGYLLYFFVVNDSIYDARRRVMTDYTEFSSITYVKVDYSKFMVVNLEDYSVKLGNIVNRTSTEITTFPILKTENALVDQIMERIYEDDKDAEPGK